ncbi:O-methyltransferase 1, chloroplastic isoform X2 [Diospyros lotus]|uniref:O-methyltransferase 1, chloroplastic isoform X2 n=1 Tax=Diospyros lotus TaxID=55363 RepID=UPI002258CCA0|nr:O-methyltransferase 1, chloroplastic isoform X2 [Diospyros lotus]
MASLSAFVPASTTAIVRLPGLCAFEKRSNSSVKAKINDDEYDSLFQAAINHASIRFQETQRPDPLFTDQYAGSFAPQNIKMNIELHTHQYCLVTKFIDEKLVMTMNNMDGPKQVQYGMDTRPYRLSWPTSTIIFDISPERVFRKAAQKLEDIGAKIPRSSLFLHIPLETSNIQQALQSKGFSGNRPSIWALQGLPLMTLESFEEILLVVGNLAMKGCLFLGEMPVWVAKAETGVESSTRRWIDNFFMSNGFRVSLISYSEIAKNLGRELAPVDYNILFVAEQLRLSDDQVETWRREFQRIEEEADEEGFEEL